LRPDFSKTHSSGQLSATREDQRWSHGLLQPGCSRSLFNSSANAIIQLLYQAPTIEISCGAKFGSDFLIYNGSRNESHAFAGLRIECSESLTNLTIPSAYDLSGFVRGLNTAAKLPLLASVILDGDLHRVAIVDLALEKVSVTGANRRAGPDAEKLRKKH
jgi:hypothetical protein